MSKRLSARYYQENKIRVRKKACGKYKNLSKEEKKKKVTIWLRMVQKSLRKCFFTRERIRNFFLLRLCLKSSLLSNKKL